MANFLFAIDSDQSRLASYIESIKDDIAPIEDLEQKHHKNSNWAVIWAANQKAPIDIFETSEGVSLLFGEALDSDGKHQSARSIQETWNEDPDYSWDGYFANLVLTGSILTVGCDLLGMFPIYYFQSGSVVLVSSSPELISRHTLCSNEIDQKGLIGILLTNGLVRGRTLIKGISRLEPGCQLRLRNGELHEKQVYIIPETDAAFSLPLAGHGKLLGGALADAVERHTHPGINYGLLLSGGLDSRMIAGLLTRRGIKPQALTLGLESDMEVRCARAAAAALGVSTINREPNPENYHEYAQAQAKWEHISNGFSQVRDWWTVRQIGTLGSRLASGILADAVVGGVAIGWAYSDKSAKMSFETFWKNLPDLSISPDVVRKLLKQEYRHLVDEVLMEINKEYDSYSQNESQKAWRYDLAHGQRYHVGISIWRLSFGAWPVIPVLDKKVLEAAGSIPAVSMADRSAQIELIRQYLPKLRHTPIDRSDLASGLPQYIDPKLRHLIKNHLISRARKLRRILPVQFKKERRYWYRVNDFDGDGWQAVRSDAEPNRHLLASFFEPEVLSAALPGPYKPNISDEYFIQPGAKKLLVGLMYWVNGTL